jgi:hypothetical protein
MTEERVRAGPETGFLAHKTPRVACDSPLPGKNESLRPWRLLEGLRKIPARFGVNPGVGSGSAALSSRQRRRPHPLAVAKRPLAVAKRHTPEVDQSSGLTRLVAKTDRAMEA